jgi:hypothetical protein
VKVLLVLLAAVGVWLVLRRRAADDGKVVVAWDDGSELELRAGMPERERLVDIAREALP